MIVCNSGTIRETLRDATLKHDFRFLDPRVIIELFLPCAMTHPLKESTQNLCKHRVDKIFYIIKKIFLQMLLGAKDITHADFSPILFYTDLTMKIARLTL